MGSSYEQFVQNLKARDIRYVVWEEKRWLRQGFDFMRSMNSRNFVILGSWKPPGYGEDHPL